MQYAQANLMHGTVASANACQCNDLGGNIIQYAQTSPTCVLLCFFASLACNHYHGSATHDAKISSVWTLSPHCDHASS